MIPSDYLGKRIKFGSMGRIGRALALAEGCILAIEWEDRKGGGAYCDYQGRRHVPSGYGSWINCRDVVVIDDESPFIQSVTDYILKELFS